MFPEAIISVFPHATIQTCIVHLLRHSQSFVTRRERQRTLTKPSPRSSSWKDDAFSIV